MNKVLITITIVTVFIYVVLFIQQQKLIKNYRKILSINNEIIKSQDLIIKTYEELEELVKTYEELEELEKKSKQ